MTVVISLIGIPLLMLNVAHLGVVISYFTRASISFFRRRFKMNSANDGESEDLRHYNMPLSVAFLIILIYILGMASVVAAAEEWPFIDAVYFTFITLATIGLGDLVPDHPLLLLVFSVFIIVGLTLVTIFIETFGLMMERRLVSCRMFATDVMAKASNLFKRRHSFTKDSALRTTA